MKPVVPVDCDPGCDRRNHQRDAGWGNGVREARCGRLLQREFYWGTTCANARAAAQTLAGWYPFRGVSPRRRIGGLPPAKGVTPDPTRVPGRHIAPASTEFR